MNKKFPPNGICHYVTWASSYTLQIDVATSIIASQTSTVLRAAWSKHKMITYYTYWASSNTFIKHYSLMWPSSIAAGHASTVLKAAW